MKNGSVLRWPAWASAVLSLTLVACASNVEVGDAVPSAVPDLSLADAPASTLEVPNTGPEWRAADCFCTGNSDGAWQYTQAGNDPVRFARDVAMYCSSGHGVCWSYYWHSEQGGYILPHFYEF